MSIALFFERLFIFIPSVVIGILILKYTNRIISSVGMSDFADRYIPGGTVMMWKLIGIGLVVLGMLVLFGYFKTYGI